VTILMVRKDANASSHLMRSLSRRIKQSMFSTASTHLPCSRQEQGLGATLVRRTSAAAAMYAMVQNTYSASAVKFNTNGQTIGAVAGNVTASLRGFGPLIMMICYIAALTFGLIGAVKWKAYAEQPDRTPFKIPIMYWGIAVLLAGFPEFMGTGIATLWGPGSQVVTGS
jgi:hypothetical protein